MYGAGLVVESVRIGIPKSSVAETHPGVAFRTTLGLGEFGVRETGRATRWTGFPTMMLMASAERTTHRPAGSTYFRYRSSVISA